MSHEYTTDHTDARTHTHQAAHCLQMGASQSAPTTAAPPLPKAAAADAACDKVRGDHRVPPLFPACSDIFWWPDSCSKPT